MPDTIPLFPLGLVLFPGMPLPLHIFEPRYRLMVRRCLSEKRPFGVVMITSGSEVGAAAEFEQVGTTARIMQARRFDDGRLSLSAVGEQRFRVIEPVTGEPYAQARVEVIPEQPGDTAALDALSARVLELLARYLETITGSDQLRANLKEKDFSPQSLSYSVGTLLQVERPVKQRVLEIPTTSERLAHEMALLRAELAQMKMVGGPSQRLDVSPPATLLSIN